MQSPEQPEDLQSESLANEREEEELNARMEELKERMREKLSKEVAAPPQEEKRQSAKYYYDLR